MNCCCKLDRFFDHSPYIYTRINIRERELWIDDDEYISILTKLNHSLLLYATRLLYLIYLEYISSFIYVYVYWGECSIIIVARHCYIYVTMSLLLVERLRERERMRERIYHICSRVRDYIAAMIDLFVACSIYNNVYKYHQ